MNAIEAEHLKKSFGDRVAVDGLDLTVEAGEAVALLGLNGAGKTTTVRMLSGLLRPDGGTVSICGIDLLRDPRAARALLNVSPQETAVAPRLTVRENLLFIARLWGADKAEARRRVETALAEFGLTEVASEHAGRLSGGWQRRLSLAMALITEPSVVFLDEPTIGLDVLARRELWRLIEALKPRGVTVLLTTHMLEEATRLCDRIAILREGRLCGLGTEAELIAGAHAATFEEAFLTYCGVQA